MSLRGLSRLLLGTFALVVVIGAGLFLWLRYETQRTVFDPAVLQSLLDSSPSTLDGSAIAQTPCVDQYPDKRAWFGDLHVHTARSFDAMAFGSTNGPEQAFAFARGEPVQLRLRSDAPGADVPVAQLQAPLDFMAVTDHAEQLGEAALCYLPESAAYETPLCGLYRGDWQLPVEDELQPLMRLVSFAIFGKDRSARVCGENGSRCRDRAVQIWQDNQRAVEAAQDNTGNCQFTAFHAFEYSLAEDSSNLHRNVVFANAEVPQALASAREAPEPELLFDWLDAACAQASGECDALAIPHNSNWSSGRMWYPYSGRSGERQSLVAMAERRSRLEPLVEIMQVKGDSECMNGLGSVVGAPDEFCDFEKLREPQQPVEDCGADFGSGGMMLRGCESRYSYVRYALTTGLAERRELGVNPFNFGIIAASDTHNAAPIVSERNSTGSHGYDRAARRRLGGPIEVPGNIATGSPVRYNPGGLAGVYAVENSRAALFAAMRARETFGTSGPRIQPRLFAGAQLDEDLCQQEDWIATAYREGVPMGGELTAADSSPVFVASASMDPGPGANPLQRIQIIKGWVDDAGATHQAVYGVAGQANAEAGVDLETCQTYGLGAAQLCATWQDPDWMPGQSAVYYARVLENPSCRWSRWDCLSLPEAERPPTCTDPSVPQSIQERAWTAPIWVLGND